MDHLFVSEKALNPDPDDLVGRIANALFNEDMKIAALAGCTFEVTMQKAEEGKIKFCMRTREKVSILKYPDGRVLNVLIKRV